MNGYTILLEQGAEIQELCFKQYVDDECAYSNGCNRRVQMRTRMVIS